MFLLWLSLFALSRLAGLLLRRVRLRILVHRLPPVLATCLQVPSRDDKMLPSMVRPLELVPPQSGRARFLWSQHEGGIPQ